jgi:hypothetical protein
MTVSAPIPWKRLIAEATAIVASILLAFSIDAWWDSRIEDQAESWLIRRLHADFVEIMSGLVIVEDEHQKTIEAARRLLAISRQGSVIPASVENREAVGLVFLVSRTFNPGSGAVEAFLNNEPTKLVRNQQLADLMIRWSALVEELQEEEVQMQKGVSERWTPFLASRTDVEPYIRAVNPLFWDGLSGNQAFDETEPLAADTEFRNHVLDRFKWQALAIRDLEPLKATGDEIVALLEEELNL